MKAIINAVRNAIISNGSESWRHAIISGAKRKAHGVIMAGAMAVITSGES